MSARSEAFAEPRAMSSGQRVVIGIASAGRAPILAETVRHMATSLQPPADEILVCTPTAEDALGLPEFDNLRLFVGPRGSCAQRNALIDAAGEADVIVFFDDDFVPAFNFLDKTVALFASNAEVAIATGNVGSTASMGRASASRRRRVFFRRRPFNHMSSPKPTTPMAATWRSAWTSCAGTTSGSTRSCRSTGGWRISISAGALPCTVARFIAATWSGCISA